MTDKTRSPVTLGDDAVVESPGQPLFTVDGVLTLTMSTMRSGSEFETCGLQDIKWSDAPAREAAVVLLTHEGRVRVLKNREGETPRVAYLVRFEDWHDNGGFTVGTRIRMGKKGESTDEALHYFQSAYADVLISVERVELTNSRRLYQKEGS